jgi:hypothetical protein
MRLTPSQVGRLDLRVVQQVIASSSQDDASVLQHIGTMSKTQGMVGILFDKQDRHAILPVDLANDGEDVADIDRSEARLVLQCPRRAAHCIRPQREAADRWARSH